MIHNFFENIEFEIYKEIKASTSKIDIAVAWLTNYGIINLLRNKSEQEGVKIRIIINDDKINNTQINQYKTLLDSGVMVYMYSGTSLMHNKFAILDILTVITGSYNWTRAAQNNLENIVVIKNNDLAAKYETEFEKVLEQSNEIGRGTNKNTTNKYLEQLSEESIWEILNYFHKIKYNPSVFRIYRSICGTKSSSIANKTKDLPFYNTISNYKFPSKVLTDLKIFFENYKEEIEKQFRYEERGWNKIDFPGNKKYNLLQNDHINSIISNSTNNINAGKKWTSSEINLLSNYILKTNNTLVLSRLLNRSERSIIKKSQRILYENKLLYEKWCKLKNHQ